MKFAWTKSRSITLTGVIGVLCLAGFFAAPEIRPQARVQAISAFAQNDDTGSLQLRFSRNFEAVAVAALSQVPTDMDGEHLWNDLARVISRNTNTVTIHPPDNQRGSEYSIIVYIYHNQCRLLARQDYMRLETIFRECGKADFVELIRQPESWLKELFNFNKQFGYTILGRRTLPVAAKQDEPLGELVFVGRPKFVTIPTPIFVSDSEVLKYPELRTASLLVQELWSKPMRSGPTSASYSSFMSETFERKIDMVRNGEYPLMCQGMRDLFLHASMGLGIKARAVEAYNYFPQFSDLITYGHSTAEVWVSGLGKWVIVDPWTGFVLKSARSTLLSANDIKQRKVAPKDVIVIPLVARLPRIFHGTGGETASYQVSPKEVSMEGIVYTPTGHAPGYFMYFNEVKYRTPTIK